jgi:SNF2 family DNA or RNA helicase
MLSTAATKLGKSSERDSRKRGRKPKLHKYQFKCVEFGVSRPAAGFFLAPGLGKTLIILTIFLILRRLGLVHELIVVAKRRIVYNVWRQEIRKWGFDFKTVILHGRHKDRNLRRKADVRLINYEGLRWLSEQKQYFRRKRRKKQLLMLAADESSKLRHSTTLRFRSLRNILPEFARRYILTGSPVPNGLMNLFGQIFALDLGDALGTYITQFRNKYFYPAGFMGYQWKLHRGARKRIYRAIRHLIIRYGTDQLDMPPLTLIDRFVRLPKAVREKYDELEREFILEYREGNIVAANAAVKSGKLRQIANGGVYYSPDGTVASVIPGKKPPRKWRTMHDEKCAELVELLEELQGEPALVSFEFEHDKFRLQRYLAKHAPQFKDAPFIDGKTKDRDVTKILRKWDKGELPVVFGQPESVAHGLNLQGKGGIVIFFALTWNLENYEQFIQRVWRQGQKRRVLVYRIICKNTTDEDMIAALALKDHDQTTLLKAMDRRERDAALKRAA